MDKNLDTQTNTEAIQYSAPVENVEEAIRMNTERGIERLTQQKNFIRDEVQEMHVEKEQLVKDIQSLKDQKDNEEQVIVEILELHATRIANAESATAEANVKATAQIKEYQDETALKHQEFLIATEAFDAKKADSQVLDAALKEKQIKKGEIEGEIDTLQKRQNALHEKIDINSSTISTQEGVIASNKAKIEESKTYITAFENQKKVLNEEIEFLLKDKLRYAERKMKLDQREEWLKARYEAAGIVWKKLET